MGSLDAAAGRTDSSRKTLHELRLMGEESDEEFLIEGKSCNMMQPV